MAGPRRDTRGIVHPARLFARVRFRRREPASALRPYLEHYWLIDWDLDEPYASHVVPHPSVNVVFQNLGDQEFFAEVAGPRHELFTQRLHGRGHVCGVQFRPGGFRPFSPAFPASVWSGRQVPLSEAVPVTQEDIDAVLGPDGEDDRVAALDAYLSRALTPAGEPHLRHATLAMELVDRVRQDRTMRRVDRLAAAGGLSVRSLQRLFAEYVGVSPKWVVLRYRIHEALERAEGAGASDAGNPGAGTGAGDAVDPGDAVDAAAVGDPGDAAAAVDWSALAHELGYSDQAHLVRDFTATVGVSPTLYGRGL
jgi:AraC-like DNA-binding protein